MVRRVTAGEKTLILSKTNIKYPNLFEKSPFKVFVKSFNHHHYMIPVTNTHTCW